MAENARLDAIEKRFDRSDPYMLALAGFAVAIYLAELRGVWAGAGIQTAYRVLAVTIDAIFVVDLLLKVKFLGKRYTSSPWFLIDFLSALPLLAAFSQVPQFFEGLRFVRGVRLFRMLRMLRTLRVLRSIRLFQFVKPPPEDSPERLTFNRTLKTGVLLYTGVFCAIMSYVIFSQHDGQLMKVQGPDRAGEFSATYKALHGDAVEEIKLPATKLLRTADEIEYYFVLGSVLGMLLVVAVARAQLPAITSHQLSSLLNVALPVQVAEHFLKEPEDYDHTVRAPATIVFMDLKGFTSTVEALGNDMGALKHHLEEALDAVVKVHARHDLIVDKFIGDCVMSFRGGDLVEGSPEDHAYRVVRAGIESPRELEALGDPYFHHLRVGGASADDVLIGTFGTSNRLSYTALGDRVNLAARLESASDKVRTSNLFCDRTKLLCEGRADLLWRRVGALIVQGKSEAVQIYEAFDAEDELSWLAGFATALERYEAKDFAAAREGFEATCAARGEKGDGPAEFYIAMLDDIASRGVTAEWTPVLALKK